jgi:hypothetical protein
MAISTNSVIHYTERIEYLKGILQCQGFKIKYCMEEINIKPSGAVDAAFPMCSFCDIPLSEVKNHIDSYGCYGIGLTKSWAKKSGLNPVLYIEKNSKLADTFEAQGRRLHKMFQEDNPDHDLMMEYFGFLAYCKNYEGRLVKGKVNSDSYRFYDEREWRYVPSLTELNDGLPFIFGENYVTDKEGFNNKIKDCYLKFAHSDISYLIVDTEDEIPEMLKTLNEVYEDIATSKELKVLSTKIMTKNQIWNDV